MAKTAHGFVEGFQDFDLPIPDGSFDLQDNATGTQAQQAIVGGAWRQTMTATDTDAALIGGSKIFWPGRGGPIIIRARIRTSNILKASMCFGLVDDIPAAAVLAENEDNALNIVVSDMAGFLFEGENADNPAKWKAISAKGGDAGALTPLAGPDMVNLIYQELQLIITDQGTVEYSIDGETLHVRPNAINPNHSYTWGWCSDARGTALVNDMDLVYWCAPRN